MHSRVSYVALLRGVSPRYATSADLTKAFRIAGFDEVRAVQSSGNVLFAAADAAEENLRSQAEEALGTTCGRVFPVMVRRVDELRALIAADPWQHLDAPDSAKRVVTFLRAPPDPPPTLPIERDGAHLLAAVGREAFTAYLPSPKGPVFMSLIEQVLGKDVTTRTWQTVSRLAR